MLRILLCLYLNIALLLVYGDSDKRLSLQEVITFALTNNLDIEYAGLSRQVERSSLAVAEQEFMPSYTLNIDSELGENISVTPSAKLKTPLGTELQIAVPQTFDKDNYDMLVARFRVVQPLWRGFGFDVNLHGLQVARENEIINKMRFRNTVSNTIVDIAKKYRNLILANYNLSSSKKALDDAKNNIKFTKAKIAAGNIAAIDLVQSQQQYESLKLQFTRDENNINNAKEELLTAVGLDLDTNIVLPDDLVVTTNVIPTNTIAIDLALANNVDYQTQLIALKQNQRSLKNEQNNQLWDINLEYSGSVSGSKYRHLSRGNNFTQSVSASISIPLNDYSSRHRVLAARVQTVKDEINLKKTKKELLSRINQQLFHLNNLTTQIALAAKTLDLAKQSYQAEVKKLELGKSSSLNVSISQDKVLIAKKSVITTKIEFENAVDDLYLLLGKTTDKWGIELQY